MLRKSHMLFLFSSGDKSYSLASLRPVFFWGGGGGEGGSGAGGGGCWAGGGGVLPSAVLCD